MQPSGALVPATLAALKADPVIGDGRPGAPRDMVSPIGVYLTLGDGTKAIYVVGKWRAGPHVAANLAALKTDPEIGDGSKLPDMSVNPNDHVTLADGSSAYYDGSAWQVWTKP